MRTFGDLESAIMVVIWAHDEPITVRDLTDALNDARPLAYSTVMTVAERLRHKGWLTRTRQGRAYRYTGARSAGDYTAELLGHVLDTSADRTTALLRFAGRLQPADAAALRSALDR
ncbi:BlaI/MecI/CopY family transcriptional regulator [Streptomyces sp. IBSNAI002]|uniref:BlaI/MecI/CopY family transcriptional regulator n=1 Tax=Streptomyces sp. IBSNAI002 TaxID=3457500 RepID=UPI003FD2DD5D